MNVRLLHHLPMSWLVSRGSRENRASSTPTIVVILFPWTPEYLRDLVAKKKATTTSCPHHDFAIDSLRASCLLLHLYR
jgi:hypothetical protein